VDLTQTEEQTQHADRPEKEVRAFRLHTWHLTVKLRGRTTTPDRRRGRTLSFSARGAKQTTPHGPLQRLLGAPRSAGACSRRFASAKQATAIDSETPASIIIVHERWTKRATAGAARKMSAPKRRIHGENKPPSERCLPVMSLRPATKSKSPTA